MQKKGLIKITSAYLSAAMLLCPTASFANTINEYGVGQDNLLTVSGSLEAKSKGVYVNLYLTKDSDTVYVKQGETDEDGEYTITVDMGSFSNGGVYTVKTVAQIEQADSREFEFYSKNELEQEVYTDLYNNRNSVSYIEEALGGRHKNRITFVNKRFGPLTDGGYAADTASFLSSELNKLDTYSEGGVVSALDFTAAVKSIEHAQSASDAAEFFVAADTAQTAEKQKALKLDGNKTLALFEKNADADARNGSTKASLTAEQLKTKTERYCLFTQNAAAFGQSYSSREDFVNKIEEALILTDIKRCRGNSSVLKMITDYSEQTGKISLAKFNNSSNDKDAVIKDIASKSEKNEINTLDKLQALLDTNKTSDNSTGGGSKKGSTGSTGGGGGIVLVPSTGYNDAELQKPEVTKFADMADYGWAKESVDALAELGMLSGVSNEAFEPGSNVTRAQFAKMMCKVFGITTSTDAASFADVAAESWYSGYVGGLYKAGYIKGIDELNFGSERYITRQDAITVIYRIMADRGLAPENTSEPPYDDADEISDYAKQAVSAVSSMQIIQGDGGRIKPQANMSRAEAAVIMYRIYKEVKQ